MKFNNIKPKMIENSKQISIPIAYVGNFKGYSDGEISLTKEMFSEIVKNFNNDSVAIPCYRGHADCVGSMTGEEPNSMAWILSLSFDDKNLYAMIELTEEMENLIDEGKFKYCSIYAKRDIDRESGEDIGMRLQSLAFTNAPFLNELPSISLSNFNKLQNIYLSKEIKMKKIKLTNDVSKETLPEAKEAETQMAEMQEGKTEDSTFDLNAALEEARNMMDPEMSMEDFVKHLVDMLKGEKAEETLEPETEIAATEATPEEVVDEKAAEASKEEEKDVQAATLSTVKSMNIALSNANRQIVELKKKLNEHESMILSSIVSDAVSKGKLLDIEKDVFLELGKKDRKLFDEMLKARGVKPSVVLSRVTKAEDELNDVTSKPKYNDHVQKVLMGAKIKVSH